MRTTAHAALGMVAAWLGAGAAAFGQCSAFETQEFGPVPLIALGGYGSAVALHGTSAAVGHPGALPGGAVSMFRLLHGRLLAVATLRPAGGSPTQFGGALSLCEPALLVGAHLDSQAGVAAGAAWAYCRSGESWVPVGKLLPPSAPAGAYFGISVCVNGPWAAVGACGDDEQGPGAGAVHVYHWTGSAWAWDARLVAPDGQPGDSFGRAVAVLPEQVLVGAYLADCAGEDSGAAYVFQRNGNAWSCAQKLAPADGAAGDWFGRALAAAGPTLVVGAEGAAGPVLHSGAAYVYTAGPPPGGPWTEQARLSAPGGAAYDRFGRAVAVGDDLVLVGADRAGAAQPNAGRVYAFLRGGPTWSCIGRWSAAGGTAEARFGGGVALAGELALVGAERAAWGGVVAGGAYFCAGAADCDADQALDACVLPARDCNWNGALDQCDIARGFSKDLNHDGVPDECRVGDADCSGQVDFNDINAFVLALQGAAAYYAQYPLCTWANADADGNGGVDFRDINAFIELLTPPQGACAIGYNAAR